MDINHIRLAHTGTMITTVCNLKCKLCCVGTPYLAEIGNFSFDRLTETYGTYFKVVEYVEKFSLGGGEPLLRPDLPELIEFFMKYQNQFGVLEVITNGTRLPSERLLKTLQKYANKTTVLVDFYGEHSPLAEQAGSILAKHGIKNQVRIYYGDNCHCNGWVDLGDLSLKHPSAEEQKILFRKCAYYTDTTRIGICACDGLLYTCGRMYYTMRKGIISKDGGGFVDLLNPSKSVEQLKKEFIELLNIEYPPACAYCNGMCADSPRYMPAEQLPRNGLL